MSLQDAIECLKAFLLMIGILTVIAVFTKATLEISWTEPEEGPRK